jgi:hypothetical protein
MRARSGIPAVTLLFGAWAAGSGADPPPERAAHPVAEGVTETPGR